MGRARAGGRRRGGAAGGVRCPDRAAGRSRPVRRASPRRCGVAARRTAGGRDTAHPRTMHRLRRPAARAGADGPRRPGHCCDPQCRSAPLRGGRGAGLRGRRLPTPSAGRCRSGRRDRTGAHRAARSVGAHARRRLVVAFRSDTGPRPSPGGPPAPRLRGRERQLLRPDRGDHQLGERPDRRPGAGSRRPSRPVPGRVHRHGHGSLCSGSP